MALSYLNWAYLTNNSNCNLIMSVAKCYSLTYTLLTPTIGINQRMVPTNMGDFYVAFSQRLGVMYLKFKCSLAKCEHKSYPCWREPYVDFYHQ